MGESTSDILLDDEGAVGDYVAVRLNSVRADRMAGFDIYIRPDSDRPFALYCQKNTLFSDSARQRLLDNDITQLYIDRGQRRDYARYIEQHLAEIVADASITPEEKSDILYTSATGAVEDVMSGTELMENVSRAKDIVKHTVTAMFGSRVQIKHFLKVSAMDYDIATHSVSVATYSVALAQAAGYGDAATLRELANGSMLHDIGKSKVNRDILTRKGPLGRQEWEEIERHPVYSHEMCIESGCLGEIALDIALHHHEKLTGNGYPDGLSGKAISPLVRIVTISDIFDALTTERPFQAACSTFVALSRMRQEMAADLDKDLFRYFVGMMGPETAVKK